MGNLSPSQRILSDNSGVKLSSLYSYAEELEHRHCLIRKTHLIDLLRERERFNDYHSAKSFVLTCIIKAKAENVVSEVTIYHFNLQTDWTYCLSSPDEASILSMAKHLHDVHGYFSRDLIQQQLTDTMRNSDPISVSHLIGRVLSSGMKDGCFTQETAYRLKCPLFHMTIPCPSEDIDLSSPLTSSSSALTDIVNLNTCN